jgi:RND superfamily putative drug exporter
MIGLGVGIDYALFILSRHRDQLASGDGPHRVDRSGRTRRRVERSWSPAAPWWSPSSASRSPGIPFVAALGYSASIVVAVAVIVAITLLPALLGVRRSPGAPTLRSRPRRFADQGERRAQRLGALGATGSPIARGAAPSPRPSVLVGTLAVPGARHAARPGRCGHRPPMSATHRRAYDLLAAGFGDGFNGPLLIAVDLGEASQTPRGPPSRSRAADRPPIPGVRAVSPPRAQRRRRHRAASRSIPTTEPQGGGHQRPGPPAPRRSSSPRRRTGSGVHALVGGPTARFIDQSDKIADRLPWFIAVSRVAVVPAVDDRVPLGPRPAQGGDC